MRHRLIAVFARIRKPFTPYPPQFQLMFWGMLISTLGASMIWPFLLIYVSSRLEMPLAQAASLISLNAGIGLVSALIGGPITDRFGRKWVMALSLAINGTAYFFLGQAQTYLIFAILLSVSGAANPLYRLGSDAMVADLIPPEHRPEAYALVRLSHNLGIALGPAIGGVIATSSYNLAFYFAAAGMVAYSLLLIFFASETLPSTSPSTSTPEKQPRQVPGGYAQVLKDRKFLFFALNFALTQMCAVLIWILMPVHAKNNFNLPESQYGLIPTTNALMVVLLQVAVTRRTRRFSSLPVMMAGTLFYALGVGSVMWMHSFWGFWASMVIMTTGELILVPTASTFVANLAPAEMRGRYMSLAGLTWNFAAGTGPLAGGWLNDRYGPSAPWLGGMISGFLAIGGYAWLGKAQRIKLAEAKASAITDLPITEELQ